MIYKIHLITYFTWNIPHLLKFQIISISVMDTRLSVCAEFPLLFIQTEDLTLSSSLAIISPPLGLLVILRIMTPEFYWGFLRGWRTRERPTSCPANLDMPGSGTAVISRSPDERVWRGLEIHVGIHLLSQYCSWTYFPSYLVVYCHTVTLLWCYSVTSTAWTSSACTSCWIPELIVKWLRVTRPASVWRTPPVIQDTIAASPAPHTLRYKNTLGTIWK